MILRGYSLCKGHSPLNQLNDQYLSRTLATLFNGHALADEIKLEVKQKVKIKQKQHPHFQPQFAAIAVGQHPASSIYLARKQEAAEACGLKSQVLHLEETVTEDRVLGLINDMNQDPNIHGIIVQLPLPSHLSESKICNAVDPVKDVDGFTQTNLGKLMQNITESSMLPCTVLAVKRIIEKMRLTTYGRNAVVIGRSHNVGLPISILLGADISKGGFDMTTISCHRATPLKQLGRVCSTADLIVSAAGVPGLVKPSMLKPGVVLVDVGLNRLRTSDNKDIVVGDMDKDIKQFDCTLTPVPGGVGPCTVACLMHNTFLAAHLQSG